ncbi:WD-repeat protein, putative [Perkinsus marinus ATCC 50983]|uniref:WD-repeat protein, putative n=1 Tax=Perkinsus marinus (strain ATCC 50983 / TXsc) TaxID=423536 RepID=C5KDT0_PERM5|nr:WD-repeat protein, putative [Perkinsus marinus ATCC 50983]EER17383.1 WD-repeat protein, putative [Perkinsus marinus ATCC 50983]|eukprot:XP_002785587.1 WD-repeat protein, putative [Perkinsus marinus ATCC 50983]
MDLSVNHLNDLLYLTINQDQTCFVIGGGRNPRFAPHKVILWDDRYPRPLAELSFRTTVKAVRMRRDMIVVAIDSKVYVYRFSDLTLIDSITTAHNPRGIIALNQSENRAVLATVADQQKGRVRISVYDTPFTAESRGPSISSVILAHDSQISQLALDASGNILATSSDKGTLIRIHDTTTGYLLQELRRGVDRADICSIVFHSSGRWIVVSSDKGTVHVFAVRVPSGGGRESRGGGGNARSKFRFFGGYFGSEWSFARFRVPDYRCIACFGSTTNTVAVMCADGSYYKAKFDPVFGGEMTRIDTGRFDAASERHRLVGESEVEAVEEPPTPAPTT